MPKKQLIGIKRCTPFQSLCDGTTVTTIYTSASTPTQELPSGIITVVNTSIDCTMEVTVSEDGTALPSYTVTPQSSITIDVTRLSSVTVVCTGTDPTAFCSGSFEADLQYTAYQS
ncbi:S-Ena type endospore appendage [Fervidibacillus halotolerans]|uniref:Endospore appendages core domain-containing protein n=1 Tax=Fervidibacillus halotolerans TaxID=2980027 RepID=A0A9E8RXD9_9BACI|nr:S-Ena type endospore appendage [Fervidibacillus halotolerans]WAA12675.1 hypothetical protein OE105_00585 [Fervidibacillus halotolerans]